MRRGQVPWLAWLVVVAGGVAGARADVKLPNVFSDHLVLQRSQPVPVWGTAAAGEKVTVRFRDQEQSATAGADGKWLVKLAPLTAGGPDKLVVAGNNSITLDDVLVGEVWVGSGQSNMQGNVGGYAKGDSVLEKLASSGPYAQLRLLRSGGRWQAADEASIRGFSAILFAFGQRLQEELKVPVGLMVGAVGGTPSGYWLSEEAYAGDAACQDLVKRLLETYPAEELQKQYERELAAWEKAAAAAKDAGKDPPKKPAPPVKPGTPAGKIGNLYEQHIRPFVPYGMRGVLWDQGESGTAIAGVDQFTLMGALIRGWRKDWNQGDFPFLYVQKPSGGGSAWDANDPVTSQAQKLTAEPAKPGAVPEGVYRETHIRVAEYPQTYMVGSLDLGAGIHPSNKSGYGQRAARVALGTVYGQSIETSGPLYAAHTADGARLRIRFTHVGQGLAFRGDRLQGFELAGEDGNFLRATATIDGDSVVLSHADIAKPVAARYAWSQSPTFANLFNKDGLPAQTFRTK